jgi:hypothetical protein
MRASCRPRAVDLHELLPGSARYFGMKGDPLADLAGPVGTGEPIDQVRRQADPRRCQLELQPKTDVVVVVTPRVWTWPLYLVYGHFRHDAIAL